MTPEERKAYLMSLGYPEATASLPAPSEVADPDLSKVVAALWRIAELPHVE